MSTNAIKDGAFSAGSPFSYRTYSVVWTATLVANIGGWMYSAASGWLMTTFTSDPLTISLVQVASNLPLFLFALPAGAIADIVDRRRLLLRIEIAIALATLIFAALVSLHAVTPAILLLFVFLIETGSAAGAPGWQAIVADLVPPKVLPRAIMMNSVGVNLSRAVGPALGGLLTAARGLAAPFWVSAVGNLATVGALVWWRSPRVRSRLPAERFASAMRTGLRHARHNRHLHATLVRALGFFFSQVVTGHCCRS